MRGADYISRPSTFRDGSAALERPTRRMLGMVRTAAFGEFYRGLYPQVFRFVFSQTDAAAADVEDIVQEILLHAWNGRDGFAARAEPETWVMSIARHKIADYWRARERSRKHQVDAVREALARIDRVPVPEELLDTVEMRRRVTEALDALEEAHARVLRLRYLDGLSVRAVAESLGDSPTAVESRLARARDAADPRVHPPAAGTRGGGRRQGDQRAPRELGRRRAEGLREHRDEPAIRAADQRRALGEAPGPGIPGSPALTLRW